MLAQWYAAVTADQQSRLTHAYHLTIQLPLNHKMPPMPSCPCALLRHAGHVHMPLVGPSGKPVLSAACFDANVKANHYRSAGKASSSSFQELPSGRFFADAHADVWRLKAAGPLPLSSTGTSGLGGSGQSSGSNHSSAGDDADYELQAVVDDSCHPRITCARETSLCSSISDVCGVAAGVCSHGLPLLGCAIAMPAPERFLYYDLTLSHLLRRVHLQLMYLDIGCSYRAQWLHYMPQDLGLETIKIGWWHARGHGPGCFLKNSGLYLPGKALNKHATLAQTVVVLRWQICRKCHIL